MRHASLAALAVGLAAAAALLPASASAAPPQGAWAVDFATPAQAEGNATFGGLTSALLVFPPGSQGSFGWSFAGGQVAHHETLRAQRDGVTPQAPLPSSQEESGAQSGTAAFGGPGPAWGSLLLQADSIEVQVAGASTDLLVPADGAVLGQDLSMAYQPGGTWRAAAQSALPAGPEARSLGASLLRLTVTGLRSAEWHNATVACDSAGPCPAPRPARDAPLAGLGSAHVLQYEQLLGGGDLAGTATGVTWIGHGQAADARVEGSVRLPLATLAQPCGGCLDPGGRTLRLDGDVRLQGLRAAGAGSDRLQADLRGDYTGGRLDEAAVSPAALGIAAATGAAAVAVTALLVRLLLLGGRWGKPRPHPRRQELMALVAHEPGITFRAIARRTGMASGVLHHHLAILQREGALVSRRSGNRTHYFENHGRYDLGWKGVSLLRDRDLRDLHEWILARPGVSRREVLEHAMAAWGWRRSTVGYRLGKLVSGGLVRAAAQGRAHVYTAMLAPQGAAPTKAPDAGAAAGAV